ATVEGRLAEADPSLVGSPREDWVWAPFSHGRANLERVMGRVAHLVAGPGSDPPPVERIDARLGLPVVLSAHQHSGLAQSAWAWHHQPPPITPAEVTELADRLLSAMPQPVGATRPLVEILAAASLNLDSDSADETAAICESV